MSIEFAVCPDVPDPPGVPRVGRLLDHCSIVMPFDLHRKRGDLRTEESVAGDFQLDMFETAGVLRRDDIEVQDFPILQNGQENALFRIGAAPVKIVFLL